MNIPLNIDWRQILLHWMNFAILAGGLYFLLYKPVRDFMEQREARCRKHIEEAEALKKEAEALKAQAQAKLDGADAEIARRRDEAEQSARKAAQEELDRARAQARRIVDQAEQAAETSRKRLFRESEKELQALALETARKLTFEPGADPFDEFLDLAEGGGGDG